MLISLCLLGKLQDSIIVAPKLPSLNWSVVMGKESDKTVTILLSQNLLTHLRIKLFMDNLSFPVCLEMTPDMPKCLQIHKHLFRSDLPYQNNGLIAPTRMGFCNICYSFHPSQHKIT